MKEFVSLWMPEQASNFAEALDFGIGLYVLLATFVLVGVSVFIILFTYKYLRKHPDQLAEAQITHNLKLEIIWSVIPFIIFMILFYWGLKTYISMRIAPSNAMEIGVQAQKWSFSFSYPNGVTDANLVVPIGKPVKLVMYSKDVIHSFFIPAFRIKQDMLPNRYTTLWFTATKLGDYHIFCTEYCGTSHYNMISRAKVVTEEEYQAYLEEQANLSNNLSPEELGKLTFSKKGCIACHSIDGAGGIGPTMKGLFDSNKNFTNAPSAKVDENYLIESINVPQAKIVAGYGPNMPSFKGQLSDAEMQGLVAYIKSLK